MKSNPVSEEIVLFLFSALIMCFFILINNWLYHAEGRMEGKPVLLREEWLNAVDGCMNGGSYVVNRARTRLIKYEIKRTGSVFAGEDFQNIGSFIELKSLVFTLSSEHSSPLARDAYNALWNSQRCSQERKSSPEFKTARRRCVVF